MDHDGAANGLNVVSSGVRFSLQQKRGKADAVGKTNKLKTREHARIRACYTAVSDVSSCAQQISNPWWEDGLVAK